MTPDPTTATLLEEAVGRLAAHGATARLEAELLLAHCLGTRRERVKSHPEEARDAAEVERYRALVVRRAAGEPLAYIVGFKDFWTLRLAVNSAVLVPRPETELLVERALALGPPAVAAVADLGTGSGAVALALASERPAWRIVATDLSERALECARHNATMLGAANVELIAGSWFTPLAGRAFDLILSNPPYVGADDPALQARELRHEPQLALSPGADALAAIAAIVRDAPEHLHRGGWLLLEHGAAQAAAVARVLVARGFTHVRSHRDLAGHERMTEACWGSPSRG